MQDRISVAVAGCGAIAQMMYLPYLSEMEQLFDLKAVCDISPELVRATCDRFHIRKGFQRFEDLLGENVDALIILTPYHSRQIRESLAAGIPVLSEKPMCFTLDDADEIVRLSKEKDLAVMVGYMKRYDPGFRLALELLQEMREIDFIRVHNFPHPNEQVISDVYRIDRFQDVPADALSETAAEIARDTLRMTGSTDPAVQESYRMLLSVASHDANALRRAFGSPEEIVSTEVWNGGSSVMSLLRYASGARCGFEVSRSRRKWFDEELAAFGRECTLSIRFPSPFLKNVPSVVTVRRMRKGSIEENSYVASYREAFQCELEEFHRCIAERRRPETDAEDAREDLRLLSAMVSQHVASIGRRRTVGM